VGSQRQLVATGWLTEAHGAPIERYPGCAGWVSKFPIQLSVNLRVGKITRIVTSEHIWLTLLCPAKGGIVARKAGQPS